MATRTVEDYIKHIYLEQQQVSQQLVSLGRLAAAMAVVPGTATTMVKALADSGLVRYEPRQGVRLTAGGERLALHVLRRHRLIELFLVKVLGLDWSEVHAEAEELEHSVSDKVLEKIDRMLGRPTVDPHGDPIPAASGRIEQRSVHKLSECTEGEQVTIARVENQDPEFLRFVDESGLVPGKQVAVLRQDRRADSVTVRHGRGQTVTLGTKAAARILVEKE